MIITKFFPLEKDYNALEKAKQKIMKRYKTDLVVIDFTKMGFRKGKSGNIYNFMFHEGYQRENKK